MDVRIEKIGPDRAQELLGDQVNRNLSMSLARDYARDMEAGDWRPNSVIQLALVDGREVMIEGQHRMKAVLLTGIPQHFVVITGLSLDDQQVIDTGRKRTLGDTLKILGETSCVPLASSIGWLWRRQRQVWTSHATPTIAEGLRVLAAHPYLRESVTASHAVSRTLRIAQGMCACLHYEMTLIDPASAADFWDKLSTGANMGEQHPVHALRSRLEKNITAVARLDDAMICALIIKAWNAYLRGDEISFIRWTRGGATPESFPVLLNLEEAS